MGILPPTASATSASEVRPADVILERSLTALDKVNYGNSASGGFFDFLTSFKILDITNIPYSPFFKFLPLLPAV